MKDNFKKFMDDGDDEGGLAKSIDKIIIEGKELEIKIQNLYHQYIKSNINTRVQNCTTVTSNDTGLATQQVELIKQFIVSELRSIDSKINLMSINLTNQHSKYNGVHQLLYKVVDGMQNTV